MAAVNGAGNNGLWGPLGVEANGAQSDGVMLPSCGRSRLPNLPEDEVQALREEVKRKDDTISILLAQLQNQEKALLDLETQLRAKNVLITNLQAEQSQQELARQVVVHMQKKAKEVLQANGIPWREALTEYGYPLDQERS